MTITRTLLKQLRTEIDVALSEIGARHDIQISTGNASFTATNATFKLNVATINADGLAETKLVTDFKRKAVQYGLQASDLGRTFRASGSTYTIAGCKVRATRYPIVARRADGKSFKFSAGMVKALLAPA